MSSPSPSGQGQGNGKRGREEFGRGWWDGGNKRQKVRIVKRSVIIDHNKAQNEKVDGNGAGAEAGGSGGNSTEAGGNGGNSTEAGGSAAGKFKNMIGEVATAAQEAQHKNSGEDATV